VLFIVAFDFAELFFAVAMGVDFTKYPLLKKGMCISDLSH
jgi:hypothetical protein